MRCVSHPMTIPRHSPDRCARDKSPGRLQKARPKAAPCHRHSPKPCAGRQATTPHHRSGPYAPDRYTPCALRETQGPAATELLKRAQPDARALKKDPAAPGKRSHQRRQPERPVPPGTYGEKKVGALALSWPPRALARPFLAALQQQEQMEARPSLL